MLISNRYLLLSYLLFQFLTIYDALTILYVVWVENDVHFVNGMQYWEGMMAVIIAFSMTLLFNTIIFLAGLTKLRTSTIAVPMIIAIVAAFYFGVTGSVVPFLGPIALGVFFGFFYSLIFYGPAIWSYVRLKSPFVTVSWLSFFYLSSILIAVATDVEGDITSKLTALLRPDILILMSVFFFVSIMLLILDNSQALARWNRVARFGVRFPVKVLLPILGLLLCVTTFTALTSPFIWEVIWEQAEGGDSGGYDDVPGPSEDEKITEDDLPQDAEDGNAGNLEDEDEGGQDKTRIDPNQELEDDIGGSDGSGGDPNILFMVKILDSGNIDIPKDSTTVPLDERLAWDYWKMQNMDLYDKKKGYYSDLAYYDYLKDETDYVGWMTNYSLLKEAAQIDQRFIFYNLETFWVMGAQRQRNAIEYSFPPRPLFDLENGSVVTGKSSPWSKGDSYEITSQISTINPRSPDRFKLYAYFYPFDYEYSNYVDDLEDHYTTFEDEKIHELAIEVTLGETSRLDKAIAIEEYFWENYEYTLSPGGPENLNPETASYDRLNYFLFENKKGYCVYYATAMTAMLQTLDIPARMVGGFAGGQYSPENDGYIVGSNTAHAWVEVYFEKYGWITFDPTPAASEDFQEEQQKKLEEQITKDVKSDLDDFNKEAEKNKNLIPEDINPPEDLSPEWEAFFESLAEFFTILFKLFPYCLILLFFLALTVPPTLNIIIDAQLGGKFSTKPDREQIDAYFKLLVRNLKKLDFEFKKKPSETSIEYFNRIKDKMDVDSDVFDNFKQVCVVHDRAVYRHNLEDGDLETMKQSTEFVLNWVSREMNVLKLIIKWWLF